jgi:DNA invertase Pin-like site-specific DNA recombinase
MNVIIYARVSTVNQDVNRQINELKEHANKENFNIIDVITETISGKKEWKTRRLAEILNVENVTGVLVWEFSRLGRNTGDVLSIINILNERKIWVYSKKENLRTLDYDLKINPSTQLMLTMLSGFAELERTTTLERSISGLVNTVKEGNWTGGVFIPYGYRREGKKLVADKYEANIVKEIFEICVNRKYGSGKIADFLNFNDIPTRYNIVIGNREIRTKSGLKRNGKSYKWASGTVYSILTNPIYINRKYGRKGTKLEGIKFEVPHIISENLFFKVGEQIKERSNKSIIENEYLLRDISLSCGICDKTYHAHKRVSKKDNSYKCLSRRYKEKCGNTGIGIPKLDSGVWTAIIANKENIDNIINSNKDIQSIKKRFKELYSELEMSKDKKNETLGKLDKLVDLYVEGSMNKNIYQTKENELNKKLTNIQGEILKLDEEIHYLTQIPKKQKNLINIIEMFENDKKTLSNTLSKLVKDIKVYPLHIHNLVGLFSNIQDNIVMVKLTTIYNPNKSINFLISQRSDMIYFTSKKDKYIEPHQYSEYKTFIKDNENGLFIDNNIKNKENFPYIFLRNSNKMPPKNRFKKLDIINF